MGGPNSGLRRSRRVPSQYRREWLSRADKRAGPVKAVVERAKHVAQDLGGIEELSRIEQDLIVRYAFTSEQCEQNEADALQGKPINAFLYLSRVDRIVRLAALIGIKRRAKQLPTLQEYLRQKAKDGDE